MGLYSPAPPARSFSDDKATLLTSWWIVAMCTVVIFLRLIGRLIRVEKLFGEDKVAALVLLPLFARMAFIHPALVLGTNNVLVSEESPLTKEDIARREIGSKLVLISRILQPAILWLLKLVTLKFFDHLVWQSGKRRHSILLLASRIILAVTFLGVVIANLAECRPFSHHWQVTPDPGGQCRQGYAYLIVHTVFHGLTELLLVAFPVAIVLKARSLPASRKALLIVLFALHLLSVAVAVYRVPRVLEDDGYQATRTGWASVEVLVATFVTNTLVLGTFVRDKGVKKKRFRYQPPQPGEEGLAMRAANGGLRTGRTMKMGLGYPDDETGDEEVVGGVEERGKTEMAEDEDLERAKQALHDRASSGSADSLIPRGAGLRPPQTPRRDNSGVMRTTTIQVAVSAADQREPRDADADDAHGIRLRPADGVVTARVQGRLRGSSIRLREMRGLPESGS
ncbi:hypothetical protein VTJ83DRAFT_6108 [Remersonia thermophila]|uniref:Rhodopsin domain-containing protein n=1 Tax=Remersonia thermophila TaxID=72144 RepID=A0ABR4D8T4_9PEZI